MKIRGTWQLKGRAAVLLMVALGLSGATGLTYLWGRGDWFGGQPHKAHLEQSLVAQVEQTPAPLPTPVSSSYKEGVVAYIYNGTPITRAQFAEYLIARFGGEKLEPFLNRAIVERACKEQGITVEPAEVDADLTDTLKSVPGDKRQFLDELLRQKQMTLKEWKEDVIRPKLLMAKYCYSLNRVKFREEDVSHAFESLYGEKRLVQLIIWTPDEVKNHAPQEVYGEICADKDRFDKEARCQWDKKLGSTAGQLKPFGRYSQDNHEMEAMAFKLHEGEITPVLPLFQGQDAEKVGAYVMKCLKHIPADATKKLSDVRAGLEREIMEHQLKIEIAKALEELKKAASPKFTLDEREGEKVLPSGPPEQVVAVIHGNVPLTREQFGEYLIDRYGAERLDLYINRLVIERACQAKNIAVADEEVEAQLKQYIQQFAGGSKTELINRMLKPNKATLYELRHDVLWPKLMLTKYCRDRVQVSEGEVRQAYESHYGEKVLVRMIMFPKDEENRVRHSIWPLLRDNDQEFIRLAKQQIVPELASRAGATEIARNATGHEEVEKIAFELQKGDISPVIRLPEAVVVFKVLDRIPPREKVKMEDVRAELEQEVIEAKLRSQVIPLVYAELRKDANPILLLRNQITEDDLKRDALRELKDQGQSIVRPRDAARHER
jgi:hypothetical protein